MNHNFFLGMYSILHKYCYQLHNNTGGVQKGTQMISSDYTVSATKSRTPFSTFFFSNTEKVLQSKQISNSPVINDAYGKLVSLWLKKSTCTVNQLADMRHY